VEETATLGVEQDELERDKGELLLLSALAKASANNLTTTI